MSAATSNVTPITSGIEMTDPYEVAAKNLTPLYERDWNVHRRVALLTAILGPITKDGNMDEGPSRYRFLSINAVRAKINPLAYRCGIRLDYSDDPDHPVTSYDARSATSVARVRAVNIDKPEDVTPWTYHTGLAFANGNLDDKHGNKAKTQGLKYATFALLGIASDEDDGDGSLATKPSTATQPPAQAPAKATTTLAKREPATAIAAPAGPPAITPAQVEHLRASIARRGIDEIAFVRKHTDGLCESVEDPRITRKHVGAFVRSLEETRPTSAAPQPARQPSTKFAKPPFS